MPKKEPKLRFKDGMPSTIGARSVVVSSATDHGSLAGLGDDDHTQYAGIAQAETITGDWTFSGTIDLDSATVSLDCAAPDADSVNVAASSEGTNTTYSRSDHTHNLDEGIAPTWTAGHTFQATMSTYDVLPGATDTYDLGSSTYWYNQMFVSQINAAVFAEEQIALLGGWLYVSHDAGTFAAEVGAADATIDFGKAMTVSDFVVVKAHVKGGAVATEYIQVGALSAGTVYNVTRDLAAAHNPDPNWAAGTPFAVLGQTGDGRIELNAYDSPRIQIIVQDDAVTYSNTTEYLRLGDMNGAFGSDAAGEWGFGVGDYSGGNYIAYNTTDGFAIKIGDGDVLFDSSGMRLLDDGVPNAISWKYNTFTGDTIGAIYSDWGGGAGDPVIMWYYSWIPAGETATNAQVIMGANDVDGGTDVRLGVCSDEYAFLSSGSFFIDDTSNANMTRGISVNQGANDDEVLAFQSSDVAHGATDVTETDTFGVFKKVEGAAGGLQVAGAKDADGVAGAALQLRGWLAENVDTTKSTAGLGLVHVEGFQTSGTSVANTVADGNVLAVRTYRGGAYVTVAIIDEDGDLHLDGSTSSYDEHDDALAIRGLAQGLAGNWDGEARYGFDELRELGVISGGDKERPFVSTKRRMALLEGAIGQLYERLQAVERAVA